MGPRTKGPMEMAHAGEEESFDVHFNLCGLTTKRYTKRFNHGNRTDYKLLENELLMHFDLDCPGFSCTVHDQRQDCSIGYPLYDIVGRDISCLRDKLFLVHTERRNGQGPRLDSWQQELADKGATSRPHQTGSNKPEPEYVATVGIRMCADHAQRHEFDLYATDTKEWMEYKVAKLLHLGKPESVFPTWHMCDSRGDMCGEERTMDELLGAWRKEAVTELSDIHIGFAKLRLPRAIDDIANACEESFGTAVNRYNAPTKVIRKTVGPSIDTDEDERVAQTNGLDFRDADGDHTVSTEASDEPRHSSHAAQAPRVSVSGGNKSDIIVHIQNIEISIRLPASLRKLQGLRIELPVATKLNDFSQVLRKILVNEIIEDVDISKDVSECEFAAQLRPTLLLCGDKHHYTDIANGTTNVETAGDLFEDPMLNGKTLDAKVEMYHQLWPSERRSADLAMNLQDVDYPYYRIGAVSQRGFRSDNSPGIKEDKLVCGWFEKTGDPDKKQGKLRLFEVPVYQVNGIVLGDLPRYGRDFVSRFNPKWKLDAQYDEVYNSAALTSLLLQHVRQKGEAPETGLPLVPMYTFNKFVPTQHGLGTTAKAKTKYRLPIAINVVVRPANMNVNMPTLQDMHMDVWSDVTLQELKMEIEKRAREKAAKSFMSLPQPWHMRIFVLAELQGFAKLYECREDRRLTDYVDAKNEQTERRLYVEAHILPDE